MDSIKIKKRKPRKINKSSAPIKLISNQEKEYVYCLCKGRHDIFDINGIVVEDAVFENTLPTNNIDYIQKSADNFFNNLILHLNQEHYDPNIIHIYIYVTGLSSALISLMSSYSRFAEPLGVKLTFMHYDRELANYLPQQLIL